MEPDKKKMLQHFPVSEFLSEIHGEAIENLWHKFYRLHEILKKLSHTEEEILKFEIDAKNWVKTFCQPNIGQMNSATVILGNYRKKCYTIYAYVCMCLILCND